MARNLRGAEAQDVEAPQAAAGSLRQPTFARRIRNFVAGAVVFGSVAMPNLACAYRGVAPEWAGGYTAEEALTADEAEQKREARATEELSEVEMKEIEIERKKFEIETNLMLLDQQEERIASILANASDKPANRRLIEAAERAVTDAQAANPVVLADVTAAKAALTTLLESLQNTPELQAARTNRDGLQAEDDRLQLELQELRNELRLERLDYVNATN
jgi:hypothetical protein